MTLAPGHARAILRTCKAEDQDFFALSSATVESLLIHADAHRYRVPKHANGSRGRYWHAYLERIARRGK